MPIFYQLFFQLRKVRVSRFTRAICDHMLYIYNYFYRSKSMESESVFVKEALGMLHHWEQVSENIFKYKPTGETIEIRKDAKIEPITKKIMQIEIPKLTHTRSQLIIRLLTEMSAELIDQYFKNNRIAGR